MTQSTISTKISNGLRQSHVLASLVAGSQLLALVAGISCLTPYSEILAEDKAAPVADGPWISSVAWQDENTLVGTRSQGLLFRPAEVVRAAVSAPSDLKAIGASENSLWSVLSVKDGGAIASDYKGGVHLFSGQGDNSSQPKSFELEARWIRALENSPEANQVLAGTEDGKLLVLDIDQAKELRRVDAHAAAIFDIAFSAKGDKVATAAGDGTIKIFSFPKLDPLGEMKVGKDAIWSLTFANEDKQIVSGGADRAIQLWDVASASSIITIATARNWVTSVVAIPNSKFVAAGCMDGNVILVNLRTLQAASTQKVAESAIWSMALSPDGKQMALATRKHGMSVVKVQPWKKAGRAAVQEAKSIRPPSPKKKA